MAGCQGACSLGCWSEVPLCEIDGRVLGGHAVLLYHHDVVNHVMMLLSQRCCVMVSWVWWRHDAVNIRMMLNFMTLSQDNS